MKQILSAVLFISIIFLSCQKEFGDKRNSPPVANAGPEFPIKTSWSPDGQRIAYTSGDNMNGLPPMAAALPVQSSLMAGMPTGHTNINHDVAGRAKNGF